MDIISPLEVGEHYVILLACAVLVARWLRDRAEVSPRAFVGAGACAALPVLLILAPGGVELLVAGKEGVLEAVTAGVLLALVVRGAAVRSPWMLIGAGLLLLEEIDYGQTLIGFSTPTALAEAGSRSGDFNSHNMPVIDALWRLIPLAGVATLGAAARWPALSAWVERVRLPRLDPRVFSGLAVLAVATLVTWWLAGETRADESAELAVVLLVALAWQPR